MADTLRRVWPWMSIVVRLVVGAVWIVAGALKITNLDSSADAVNAYDVLGPTAARIVGSMLPPVEILVGTLLVIGLAIRLSALLSALLFIVFIAGISQAWVRGIRIDCGCFGGGGFNADATSQYPWEIARDVGLLILCGLLMAWPRSKLSLDSVLMPATYADTHA